MTRRHIAVAWALVSGIAMLLYGYATHRSGEDLAEFTAWFLYLCGIVQLTTLFLTPIQTGVGAALRASFCVTAFVLRASVLLAVGSQRSDRTGELIGASLALCWAAAILIFRLMVEMANRDAPTR